MLVGGAGRDVCELRYERRVLIIVLDGGTSSLGAWVHGFETVLGVTYRATNVLGGMAAEYLVGGDLADTLDGGGGGGGDDALRGAKGRDVMVAGAGDDRVWGGNGDDTGIGAHGDLTAHPGADVDRLTTAKGKAAAFLDGGNDHWFIADGTVLGGDGNEWLAADYITTQGGYCGGDGYGTVSIAKTHGCLTAILNGGAGDDLFEIRSGGGRAVLNGGNGDRRGHR